MYDKQDLRTVEQTFLSAFGGSLLEIIIYSNKCFIPSTLKPCLPAGRVFYDDLRKS